jgi:nitrate reductase gamma subunit
MVYTVTLYIALILFAAGLLFRLVRYFGADIGNVEKGQSAASRFFSSIAGILQAVFSVRIFAILKTFFLDVLFQANILRDGRDRLVWFSHILIFWGFLLLLLMHALDSILTARLFPDYQPTLNPFFLLRDIFGLMALIGLILAGFRRFYGKRGRIYTHRMDITLIVLVAVILVSGFLLSAAKIGSVTEYNKMVNEYFPFANQEENRALKAYWGSGYGLVLPESDRSAAAAVLEKGKELHEVNCIMCHAKPQTAFASYSLRSVLSPVLYPLDRVHFATILFYIHFLACFIGLAYFPFSKFYHVIATALSLLVAAGTSAQAPENRARAAARTVLELDGCSHGGLCHDNCPVKQQRELRIQKLLLQNRVTEFLTKKNDQDLGCRPFQG